MEFFISETNREKKSLIYDGYTFRVNRVLKNSEISWRCTKNSCKCRIRTDAECKAILKGKNEHNHPTDDRKLERQQVSVSVKRKATDISTRPAKIIRQTLQETEESHLQSSDLKIISQSLYRQRRKEYPALPKDRMETHACLENLAIKTSKDENFSAYNDSDAGMIIFTCSTNLQCMCDVDDIFIDGTFKCCPKTFSSTLFYSWLQEWELCTFTVCLITFKRKGCVPYIREEFREVEIKGCRFHLGQAWYRKIQSLGLAQDYKDKSSEIGKWLSPFFGLPFLPPDETEDSFVEEMIPEAPTNK